MTNGFELSEIEKERLLSQLAEELPVLRTKLGISQAELASLIDISRQTYSTIETKRRKLSWGIYLSLILVFDRNAQTHDYIRKTGLFPKGIVKNHEPDIQQNLIASFVRLEGEDICDRLDEQAIHAIELVMMIEYARCNNMTGDAVIKAFKEKDLSMGKGDMCRKKLQIESKKYREESVVISSRMPKDMLQDIDYVAANTGRTRNEIMQLCLDFALKNTEVIQKEE